MGGVVLGQVSGRQTVLPPPHSLPPQRASQGLRSPPLLTLERQGGGVGGWGESWCFSVSELAGLEGSTLPARLCAPPPPPRGG